MTESQRQRAKQRQFELLRQAPRAPSGTITLEYDDQPNDVIEKVNRALKTRGLRFASAHGGDGTQSYSLRDL
jgi:hypothetical protein